MPKLWPVFAITAAAVVAVVLMLGGEGGGRVLDEDEPVAYDEHGNPILLTSEGAGPREEPDPQPEEPRQTPTPASAAPILVLEGIVVDAETRKPIAAATLHAESSSLRLPCPRLPAVRGSKRLPSQGITDSQGRFRWMATPEGGLPAAFDVFVQARRYVTMVLCDTAMGGSVTVSMRRALQQPVQVTDLHGRPIEAAALVIVPAEGTPALPGHAGNAFTDRNGRAEVDGLIAGDVMLEVDHPEFMPSTIGPFDPATGDELVVKLAPALRLMLEIRSDDASDIKNPTLAWETNGTPPHRGLVLLKTTPAGPDNATLSEVHAEPVRIPCDHREVRFEVKADGFEPWIPEAEPLPIDGGERKVIASLRRDLSLGSLVVRFEDADGEPVNYAEIQPVPTIMRLDEQAISSGIVLETAETLNFPAIPAGPYRIGVRTPKYAPGAVEVTVRAGEKTEALCKLEEPAKLKIQFVSNERTLVRFRLMKAGQLIPAFPEGVPPSPNESGTPPLVVQGNEGTVFTGLPPGPLVIHVTSPELVAAPTTVQLRAGETTETEIQVRFR